jgi:methylenetetrahydrofolate dehydrogenase (NADP+)/methenyltetrahydrofolate cyclohydrolase
MMVSAEILDGKAIAEKLKTNLATRIAQGIKVGQRRPALAVVLVGEDSASQIYVRNKCRACEQVGITSLSYELPAEANQADLLALIDELNQNSNVDGILIQLPLPRHINEQAILERINVYKDVDGFHPYNLGRLAQKNPTLRPCTPYGIIKLLDHYQISLAGLHATVVGASNIVGRPMALELLNAGCTVTICHSQTQDLAQAVSTADLLIVAIGKPGVIKTDWIKPGAVVIDIGINRLADGHVIGDLDFELAKHYASWITPVPGGVGPMTVATLLHNTYLAAQPRAKIP